jgi:hypothetical protein
MAGGQRPTSNARGAGRSPSGAAFYLVGALTLVLRLTPAHACSPPQSIPYDLDPKEQAIDHTSPGPARVMRASMSGADELCHIAILKLRLYAEDDRTRSSELGWRLEYPASEKGPFESGQTYATDLDDGSLTFGYYDPQDTYLGFHLTITAQPVDRAGNVGPPVLVEVWHPPQRDAPSPGDRPDPTTPADQEQACLHDPSAGRAQSACQARAASALASGDVAAARRFDDEACALSAGLRREICETSRAAAVELARGSRWREHAASLYRDACKDGSDAACARRRVLDAELASLRRRILLFGFGGAAVLVLTGLAMRRRRQL